MGGNTTRNEPNDDSIDSLPPATSTPTSLTRPTLTRTPDDPSRAGRADETPPRPCSAQTSSGDSRPD
jgi:hypothetical protein